MSYRPDWQPPTLSPPAEPPKSRLALLIPVGFVFAIIGFVWAVNYTVQKRNAEMQANAQSEMEGVRSSLSETGAYQEAVTRAKADERVVDELGEPITADAKQTKGSFKISGPWTDVKASIPISGPKASGMLYVSAQSEAGQWHFFTLAVSVNDKLIKLRLKAAPATKENLKSGEN